MRKLSVLILLCLLYSLNQSGQTYNNLSDLSIEKIMKGEDFVGYLPKDIRWSEDSKTIFFTWNPRMEKVRDVYQAGIHDLNIKPVTVEVQKQLPVKGEYNAQRTKKTYSRFGDIFLYDLNKNTEIKITSTLEVETNPTFSQNDTKIVYQKENNLYSWDITSGTTVQLTNFNSGSEKSDKDKPEYEQWLEKDQLAHFEIIKERKEISEIQEKRNKLLEPKRPKAFYLDGQQIFNIQINPDATFVTFILNTSTAENKNTKVPSYVTRSGYTEDIPAREKVGTSQDKYKFYIYNIEADTVYTFKSEKIEGIYDKPEFLKEYDTTSGGCGDQFENPRDIFIHGPYYSENGAALIEAKSMDGKDRWILLLQLETGEPVLLERQHDEAWIGGPGISGWKSVPGNMGWIDNNTVWFQSEQTGYSHLYTCSIPDKKKTALTSGSFEILDVTLSHNKKTFYITSNRESPFEHHFYHLPANGGEMKKITSMAGNNEVTVSPDEKFLAIRYSNSNTPWELYILPNKAGETEKRISHSLSSEFKAYPWREPEIIQFKASDGVPVPARIYIPEENVKNGAAVIFVHGAGYLQNVHRWWSDYYREYMFHNFLCDNGYTVLDIDYRGSEGYGRDWRTAIYRHMGGRDLNDQVDGAKYLVERYGINKDKIGIYGGSYGGFITLMALFTKPGTFRCGAALRSVVDWAHYNHPYTVNILNTPVEDSIAYYRSSPLYYAEGLQDNLLMLHGVIDTNVQFQDIVRLSQRLIELGKNNWELALFPLEDHGFKEASSWTDEYKRIYKLFQENLIDKKE
ncbi:MAG: prolyl oligopeptidase family serine peptidase [Bacteroidales bacterium]|nr:prolyl oligopeptidase family serine peptidase [Bacteroidales bacterium]